ncbi:hypothetical protein [Conexibacter sp. CPCC 206217]|uniref:hypothetical protein n=1 Tax=Conexibacter sp. CPCC 206217 TaxID=3064574 RepID=UPI0027281310|nr:hypothetical protein [Conexibacter sp. CPCC 206217]MDO8211270.1 hypothetical protein [Conexibacter sp. CPCC 206217]
MHRTIARSARAKSVALTLVSALVAAPIAPAGDPASGTATVLGIWHADSDAYPLGPPQASNIGAPSGGASPGELPHDTAPSTGTTPGGAPAA